MQPEIRPATVEDAEAGAWCHLLCWREAYDGLVPADVLLERTSNIERRIGRWRTHLGAGAQRWIALNPDPTAAPEDRVAGFIGTGPGRDEDSPVPFELEAIYTRQAFWRTGLGGRRTGRCRRQAARVPLGVRGQRACPRVLPTARLRTRRRPQTRPVLRPLRDPPGPQPVPPAHM